MAKGKPIEHYVDENGCHICMSHKIKKFNGKSMRIHTYIYLTRVRKDLLEIPEGKIVAHKCGNEKCINPDHLTLTTKEEAYSKSIEFDIDPVTGCHICTSHHVSSTGYPQITVNGKDYNVHRYVYETEVYEKKYGKKIPAELVVRHKCDNPLCINPVHLEIGTHADNARDRVERGRQARGSRHGAAKLTEEDVREIRRRLVAGERCVDLARVYGVHPTVITDIKLRKKWKHVD